jgi:hypothetical protein
VSWKKKTAHDKVLDKQREKWVTGDDTTFNFPKRISHWVPFTGFYIYTFAF